MAQSIPGNVSGRLSNNSVPDHAMAAAPAEMPTAGAYEDQKNNGNRRQGEDQFIGGAEKGGPGFNEAQRRLPPDAVDNPNSDQQADQQKENHDSPVEGSRDDIHIEEDRSK